MTPTGGRVEPAYRVLASSLRDEIRAGVFPPTRRLPTDAELSSSFGLSRQTVRRAFNDLVAEGLVYRVPGRGSFAVAAPSGEKYLRSLGSINDLLALSEDTELEMILPFASAVDIAAASRLRLATDDVFIGIFRRLHDGVPFSVTTTYLPPEFGAPVAGDRRVAEAGSKSAATIIGLIEEATDSPLIGAYQSISATLVDPETAELIGCAPGDAALSIDRIYFDAHGRFVELSISTFNVSRYSYRLELRRSDRH
jgi:DNA-binding GntR family transcriptional regulator